MIRKNLWTWKSIIKLKLSFHTLILILISTSFICKSFSQSLYTRKVEFDWESIPGAISYEVSIEKKGSLGDSKSFLFETKEPIWRGKLAPGSYEIKLRSKDKRRVPGEWSPPSDLNVALENATKLVPNQSDTFRSKSHKMERINFSWKEVGGAQLYELQISSLDGLVKITKNLEKNNFEIDLPVAKKYKWSVLAKNEKGIQSESLAISEFTIIGRKLSTPSIDHPESEFVRELAWENPEYSESFQIKLSLFNKKKNKWEIIFSSEEEKKNILPFNKEWNGGKYELLVKAKGTLRESSDMGRIIFKVRNGDRSLNTESRLLVKKSIDRSNGWYGIASYLITQIQYVGQNYETGGLANFSAIGGTGRLGLGFEIPNKKWGFLGIADLSGFFYNGSNHTFSSFEANSTYRIDLERSKLIFQIGAFLKELPDISGNPGNQTIEKESRISGLGPHFGSEFWHSFNPKLGFQMNTHIYFNYKTISTPNNEPLTPTFSYQVGFLGSYRFTPKFTGLMGYARRVDRISYQASINDDSYARPGDRNRADISGDYLNFFAEWNF